MREGVRASDTDLLWVINDSEDEIIEVLGISFYTFLFGVDDFSE